MIIHRCVVQCRLELEDKYNKVSIDSIIKALMMYDYKWCFNE